jgi:hypothetical protein
MKKTKLSKRGEREETSGMVRNGLSNQQLAARERVHQTY